MIEKLYLNIFTLFYFSAAYPVASMRVLVSDDSSNDENEDDEENDDNNEEEKSSNSHSLPAPPTLLRQTSFERKERNTGITTTTTTTGTIDTTTGTTGTTGSRTMSRNTVTSPRTRSRTIDIETRLELLAKKISELLSKNGKGDVSLWQLRW